MDDPVDAQDVATKNWSETTGSSFVGAASASASAAATSATAAASSASAASTSASAASTSASNAANSATNASTFATAAASSATSAATQATNAATSATNAASSATAAASSASAASTSATAAASAQTAAEAARDATLTAFDNFDDRYLGSKTSDPTVDNDGNALITGSLYFNSVAGEMRVYTGSAWVAAYVSGTNFVAKAGDTMTGTLTLPNLTFSGLGRRITGDFSDASAANRVSFKTSIANGNTSLQVLPNGTGVQSSILLRTYDIDSLANGSVFQFIANDSSNESRIATVPAGTGTAHVMTFHVNGSERLRIGTDGRVTVAKASSGTITALTDGATITPDFSAANNFSVTLGGNRTLANPTNLTAGQSGAIVITQDGTGSRTLAYGSYWKFPSGSAPVLTTTANAVDVLVYYVESATRITARLISDVK